MLKWTRRKKEIKTDWSIFAMTKLRPSFVINHKSLIAVIIYISSEVVNQKACDSLYLHLFLKLKDSDVVAFHHYSLAFLSTISSQNEHCIVGHSTSSQGLPAFNSKVYGCPFLACLNSTKEHGSFTRFRGLPRAGKYSDIIWRGA